MESGIAGVNKRRKEGHGWVLAEEDERPEEVKRKHEAIDEAKSDHLLPDKGTNNWRYAKGTLEGLTRAGGGGVDVPVGERGRKCNECKIIHDGHFVRGVCEGG